MTPNEQKHIQNIELDKFFNVLQIMVVFFCELFLPQLIGIDFGLSGAVTGNFISKYLPGVD